MQDKATQKGGYKTRYLALCILIEYLDPFKFTIDNPNLIKEVMQSTTETLASGKYVLNFFEALLKKALTKSNQEAEKSKPLTLKPFIRMVRPMDRRILGCFEKL